jgi:hypothetical protein
VARRYIAGAAPAPSADLLEGSEMTLKDSGQSVSSTLTAKTTSQNNDLDFATTERRRKAKSTAFAMLALRGFTVHEHPNGDFLVSGKGLSHYLQDLEALQDFAEEANHG